MLVLSSWAARRYTGFSCINCNTSDEQLAHGQLPAAWVDAIWPDAV